MESNSPRTLRIDHKSIVHKTKPVVAECQTDYTVYFKNGTDYAWAGRAATQANIRLQEGVGVGGYLSKFLLGVCR